jgi:hypothetical protein
MRRTIVTVDRIEPTGDVIVHEEGGKNGFFTNTTPRVAGTVVRERAKLEVDVAEYGEVLLVKAVGPNV